MPCERLNAARLPREPVALTVTPLQVSRPGKATTNEPLELAVARRRTAVPTTVSFTRSRGWKLVPFTRSGSWLTGMRRARPALALVSAEEPEPRTTATTTSDAATSADTTMSALVRDRSTTGHRRVLLLVGAVGAAHQRPGEDRAEAERLALLAEPADLVRLHPAVDLRVLRARLEVLPDRDHVDPVRAEVAHRVDDLVVRLAEPDDDSGLGQHRVVGQHLRAGQQPQGF